MPNSLELAPIWMKPLEEVTPSVIEVSGWEHVEAAWQRGQGIVFLTPHLGCFEIAAQYYAAHAPVTVLYRRPKRVFLQVLIETGRRRENVHLAPADVSGVRLLVKARWRSRAWPAQRAR